MTTPKVLTRASWLLALLLGLTPTASAGPAYIITDLGDLGGDSSTATAINDAGVITGSSLLTPGDFSQRHAFVYSKGTLTDLGTLGGTYSYGQAINASGQIAGLSTTDANSLATEHAVTFQSGTITDLGTLGATASDASHAYGINAKGQVVGDSTTAGQNATHAFLSTNGTLTDLGAAVAGGDSFGVAINNAGLILGDATLNANHTGNPTHAMFIDAQGNYTDLGTLGGDNSYGLALNNKGVAAGYSTITPGDAGTIHAFITSGTLMKDLGTLPGGTSSAANGINDASTVVGYSYGAAFGYIHATIDQAGTLTDLNTLLDPNSGWTLLSASAINNKGQIVGFGFNPDGHDHAFLLTPTAVPEPSALALATLGTTALGLSTRRRTRGIARFSQIPSRPRN